MCGALKVAIGAGATGMWDAVWVISREVMPVWLGPGRRALLLITDGVDNCSKHTLSEAIERTKRSHVAVYTVGLLSRYGGEKAEESLLRIAEASGGRAFFPSNVEEARTDMERVARDLREQYTLGYFPSNPSHNGGWRSIRVDVIPPVGPRGPVKLTANYRHGYYGPGDSN